MHQLRMKLVIYTIIKIQRNCRMVRTVGGVVDSSYPIVLLDRLWSPDYCTIRVYDRATSQRRPGYFRVSEFSDACQIHKSINLLLETWYFQTRCSAIHNMAYGKSKKKTILLSRNSQSERLGRSGGWSRVTVNKRNTLDVT